MTKTFCDRCGKELTKPEQRTYAIDRHAITIKGQVHNGRDWQEGVYCKACLIDIIREDHL